VIPNALDLLARLTARAPDDVPAVSVSDSAVVLAYLSGESYSARVSPDFEVLRVLDGHTVISSEVAGTSAGARLVLWYGPQVVQAPPAPVSAKKK
jgi:hypothetical protein